jgi:MFS superfamily sulfate permease-like transporter
MNKRGSFLTDNAGWIILGVLALVVSVIFILFKIGKLGGLGELIRRLISFGG